MARKIKPKSALELARSTPSAVALASFDRPGGSHGKHGKRANRHDRRNSKQSLRRGDW